MRAVLEVILQNFRGKGWVHRGSLGFDRATYFTSAYNFCC
jgi:hypothetical protein